MADVVRPYSADLDTATLEAGRALLYTVLQGDFFEQRGLTDPRLAPNDQHSAPAQPRTFEQLVDPGAVALAANEHE